MSEEIDIYEEIREVISKGMAKSVFSREAVKKFDELLGDRARLEKASQDRAKLILELRGINQSQADRIGKLERELQEWKDRDEALVAREKEVEKREFRIELSELRVKSSSDRLEDYKQMLEVIFKNRFLSRSIFETERYMVQEPGMTYYSPRQEEKSKTITETINEQDH